MTIATVLHDLNLAALYCDRVALLKAGRLVRLGPPAEVISYARCGTFTRPRSMSTRTTSPVR